MEMLNGVWSATQVWGTWAGQQLVKGAGIAVEETTKGVNTAFAQIDRFQVGNRLAQGINSSYGPLAIAISAQVAMRTFLHYENSEVDATSLTGGARKGKKVELNEQTWTTLAKQAGAVAAGFTLLQLALNRKGPAGINSVFAKNVLISTALTIGDDRAIEGLFAKERDGKMGYIYKGVAATWLATRLFDLGLHQGVGFKALFRGNYAPMQANLVAGFQTVRGWVQ